MDGEPGAKASSMSGIIRVKKDAKYFVASNEPFNDKELSWEARGVLGYLLSKPDNWITRTQDIVKRGPAGEYKVTRILNELKRAGYIRRERHKNKLGQFEWETVVYESRTIPQLSTNGLSTNGLPTDGLSTDGKPPHIEKTESPNTDLSNTNGRSPEGGGHPPTLSPSAASPSALEIYKSVTKIKKADKIPEVVTDWLDEQQQYMPAARHPECLRQAIKRADKEGQVFNVELLDEYFLDYLYPQGQKEE